MFEKTTTNAQRALQIASQEAKRLGYHLITPEYILLGILKTDQCRAITILCRLGVNQEAIVQEAKALLPSQSGIATTDKLPQSPLARKVIEYAMNEARTLHHNYVGTEHLLLGLLSMMSADITAIFYLLHTKFSLTLNKVRDAITNKVDEQLQLKAGQALLDLLHDAGAKEEDEIATMIELLKRPPEEPLPNPMLQAACVAQGMIRYQVTSCFQRILTNYQDSIEQTKSTNSSI